MHAAKWTSGFFKFRANMQLSKVSLDTKHNPSAIVELKLWTVHTKNCEYLPHQNKCKCQHDPSNKSQAMAPSTKSRVLYSLSKCIRRLGVKVQYQEPRISFSQQMCMSSTVIHPQLDVLRHLADVSTKLAVKPS